MALEKFKDKISEFKKNLRFKIKNSLKKISIKDIERSPVRYIGKKVNLVGVIKHNSTVGTFAGFNLFQGRHFIPVKTKQEIAEGNKILLTGIVKKQNVTGLYMEGDSIKVIK